LLKFHFSTEKSQINDLILHLKLPEKQEQAEPKTSRREAIKIKAETNKIETKNPYKRINKTKKLLFEKINKIDKPLAKIRREKIQIN
jgi:hypothetical protein